MPDTHAPERREVVPVADLRAAVAEAREEVARTDSKAGTLLALATGALAGLVAFAHSARLPVPVAVTLLAGAAMAGAAIGLLLFAVRPRLIGSGRDVLGDHRELLAITSPHELYQRQVRRLEMFSGLAVAKHRLVRRAADFLLAALVLLAVAAVLTAGGIR